METENSYVVKDAKTGRQLLLAKEDSLWCARNPCICCDCNCWCLDCNFSSRRPFTLTMMEDEGSPMVLEMSRPLASDCLPCCLQSITVRDQTHPLGSVNQVKIVNIWSQHNVSPGGWLRTSLQHVRQV